MADINGSYRHADRPIIYFEAQRDGEKWLCTAKIAGAHFTEATWQPSPWPMLERLVAVALDSKQQSDEPSKWDFNKKLAKPATPTPLRRRGARLPPGSVPQWTPPET